MALAPMHDECRCHHTIIRHNRTSISLQLNLALYTSAYAKQSISWHKTGRDDRHKKSEMPKPS